MATIIKRKHLRLAHSGDVRAAERRQRLHNNRKLFAGAVALGFGALGTAVANVVGIGEIMFGAFVAYVAYRTVRYGVSPTQAVIEGVELEHGRIPEDFTAKVG